MNLNTHLVKKGRIFKNPILEFFAKNNPRYTALYYILLIPLFLCLNSKATNNSIYTTLGLYCTGLFMWTLKEYLLHRFLFHIDDFIPAFKKFHYIVHGIHHEYPRDEERLLMPPLPGTMIVIILTAFWYFIIKNHCFAFMAGVTTGYLIYTFIHYSVHTRPANRKFRFLWAHHALHHFKYPDKAFGVSSPLWDWVFGTMPERKK